MLTDDELDALLVVIDKSALTPREFLSARTAISPIIKELRELRAARQWRPIETAPKDVAMLVWCQRRREARIADVKTYGNRDHLWMATDDFVEEVDPSRWMPLPEPPKEGV